jgi:hypothetical protein
MHEADWTWIKVIGLRRPLGYTPCVERLHVQALKGPEDREAYLKMVAASRVPATLPLGNTNGREAFPVQSEPRGAAARPGAQERRPGGVPEDGRGEQERAAEDAAGQDGRAAGAAGPDGAAAEGDGRHRPRGGEAPQEEPGAAQGTGAGGEALFVWCFCDSAVPGDFAMPLLLVLWTCVCFVLVCFVPKDVL